MGATTSLKPYTQHQERAKQYEWEIGEIQKRHFRPSEKESLKKQALLNMYWCEFYDATTKLLKRRVRITQAGHVLSVEYLVLGVIRLKNIQSKIYSCFGILYKNEMTQVEEILEIAPTAKIFIIEE